MSGEIIRDQYGHQIGRVDGKNYLGETVIRDTHGNIIGTKR